MTTPQGPRLIVRPSHTIELDFGQFAKFGNGYGWITDGRYDYDLVAAQIGISERQTRRVLDAETRPSTTFIGGLLNLNELVGFRRLFRVVDTASPIGRE